jgi:hypothetical protein
MQTITPTRRSTTLAARGHGSCTHSCVYSPPLCVTMACRCNEVGYFQDAAPANHPTLVSRLDQPSSDEVIPLSEPLSYQTDPSLQRQCEWMFPAAFSSPPVPPVQNTNKAYGGWDMSVPRLFFATAHSALYVSLYTLNSCADRFGLIRRPLARRDDGGGGRHAAAHQRSANRHERRFPLLRPHYSERRRRRDR